MRSERPPSARGQSALWHVRALPWPALLLLLAFWDPRRDGTVLAPIASGLAMIAAGTVWLGAIIGVLTASWRAV